MSTRSVELSVTLNVEVDCSFEGDWIARSVEAVFVRKVRASPCETLGDFLLDHFNEDLADLFAEQEP